MNGSPDSFADIVDQVLGTQNAPSDWLILATAAVALAVVAFRPVWRVARTGITIAHEGGHALVAVLVGRRLSGIRLHSDTSGLTVSRGRPTGPGMVLTLLAGYIAASLLGLGGAWLLAADRITMLLWLSLLLLAVMVVWIRNLYGFVAVVLVGGAIFAVTWYAEPDLQAVYAYALVWLLLVGGVRPVMELQARRRRQRSGQSDADQLARLTRIPGLLWVGFFGVVNLAALAIAVWTLLWPAVESVVA